MPVDKVSRRDVADLLTTLATVIGPVSANRVRSSFERHVQLGHEGGEGRNQSGSVHQQGKREGPRTGSRRSRIIEGVEPLPEGDFATLSDF